MAPGPACINELVIIQASQGLCRYVEKEIPDAKERGVVIGYDGRHNSRSYAEYTAAVFMSVGIPVYFPPKHVATPFVPFAVVQYKAAAGVMVTASHNPKDDNGYKVYWANGAQIISPMDSFIANLILENQKPWHEYKMDLQSPLLREYRADITSKYNEAIAKRYSHYKSENASATVKATYTAMHGVGAEHVVEAFRAFNLPPYIPAKEQVEPDPDFPTVAFPNPEEGKGALALAIRTADEHGSTLILANDPDADRLAVAVKNTESKEWAILNGNEIALLLADYVWTHWSRGKTAEQKAKAVMLSSTVSSQVLAAMARVEGFHFADTLTGFKWLGNTAISKEHEGYEFLFAFEVEIGFLIGNLSYDKDGIRTAAVFYEMTNWLARNGQSPIQRLDSLYKKYGYFSHYPNYFFCDDVNKIERIFVRLRALHEGSYPKTCGSFAIDSVRDVTLGHDTAQTDGKALLPTAPDSQMLTFRFANGSVATLRNSGTEPKLKYYVESSHPESRHAADAITSEIVAALIKAFIQPDVFGLKARGS